jgi:hypothetical protein
MHGAQKKSDPSVLSGSWNGRPSGAAKFRMNRGAERPPVHPRSRARVAFVAAQSPLSIEWGSPSKILLTMPFHFISSSPNDIFGLDIVLARYCLFDCFSASSFDSTFCHYLSSSLLSLLIHVFPVETSSSDSSEVAGAINVLLSRHPSPLLSHSHYLHIA